MSRTADSSLPLSPAHSPIPSALCLMLDKPCGIVNPETPQSRRRSRRLCRAPHGEKSGLFILATSAPRGRGYILARRRPDVRETQAASTAGERRLASFFVTTTNSQQ